MKGDGEHETNWVIGDSAANELEEARLMRLKAAELTALYLETEGDPDYTEQQRRGMRYSAMQHRTAAAQIERKHRPGLGDMR